jgi:hypothetical protein
MDNLISNAGPSRSRQREGRAASEAEGDDLSVFSKMLEEKTQKMERDSGNANQEIYSDKREKEKAEEEERVKRSRMNSGAKPRGMKDELLALSLKDPSVLSMAQKKTLGGPQEGTEAMTQGAEKDARGPGMTLSTGEQSSSRAAGSAAAKDTIIQEKSKDITKGPGMALTQEGQGTKEQQQVASKAANESEKADAARNVKREEVIRQIIQHVELRNIGNRTELSLKLNPEYLGEMRIKLIKDGENITAQFQTVSPVVREAIEESQEELMSTLNEYGVKLNKVKVDLVDEVA